MAEQGGLIPIGQASRLLMVSEQWIRDLTRQGFIPKCEKRGFVQLVGAVQGYIRFLKDQDRRSSKVASESRVKEARAREIELRIAERERDLIPLEDALADMAELVGMVRSETAGLPARLTRIIDERQKIESEINGFLIRLADRAAEKAASLEAGRSYPEAADEAEPGPMGEGEQDLP